MRRLPLALLLLGCLLAPAAWAEPSSRAPSPVSAVDSSKRELFAKLVMRERSMFTQVSVETLEKLGLYRPNPNLPRTPSTLTGAASTLDCVHAKHDITLHPSSGETTATLELRVRATGGALSSVGLSFDEGLNVGNVTATGGHTTQISQGVQTPSRVVVIRLEPALQPNEETIVTIPYSGSLACAMATDVGTTVCEKGSEFAFFAHQSIFPYIFDPSEPAPYQLDALTRDVVMRVPSSMDVIVTGQRISEVSSAGTKTSTWAIEKPLSRIVGMYAFIGSLGLMDVVGRPVPTTLVFPAPEKQIDHSLVSWSKPALEFIEKSSAGLPLPFTKNLSLIRLPETIRDPGTATYGMTLLSDAYSRAGDLMYEETWAHENAHLFWGIVAPETNSYESRLMSEGMATLTEIDYSYARHFQNEDRDLYLARRFLPMGLDIRAQSPKLPAVQLAEGEGFTEDFRTQGYTLWAYYKTSATLDHMRATVGDDVFAKALTRYLNKCSYVGCRPDALRESIEAENGGKSMKPFFDRWVTGNGRPQVLVGFTAVPGATGADVELLKLDDQPMTLDLWVSMADGKTQKQKVELSGTTSTVHIDTPSPVLRVAMNPRHDVLVDVQSSVKGDLDFDGESDGFDLLRCTRQVGRKYESKGAGGLWNVDETFDPRCDVNHDNVIDDKDITLIAEDFGNLRPR